MTPKEPGALNHPDSDIKHYESCIVYCHELALSTFNSTGNRSRETKINNSRSLVITVKDENICTYTETL